jgi:hypothetical protein
MVKKILFIEGTADDSNGELRKGFRILFEKKLKDKMPQIIMGNDKNSTARKFLHSKMPSAYALMDLDGKEIRNKNSIEELKTNDLSKFNRTHQRDFVFYMVQEMEAWFLSQPEILQEHFTDLKSTKIPKKNSQFIPNPSVFLQKLVKNTKKGEYHKVKDAVPLLCKLDIEKLMVDFDDVKKLIETLNTI